MSGTLVADLLAPGQSVSGEVSVKHPLFAPGLKVKFSGVIEPVVTTTLLTVLKL